MVEQLLRTIETRHTGWSADLVGKRFFSCCQERWREGGNEITAEKIRNSQYCRQVSPMSWQHMVIKNTHLSPLQCKATGSDLYVTPVCRAGHLLLCEIILRYKRFPTFIQVIWHYGGKGRGRKLEKTSALWTGLAYRECPEMRFEP